MTIKIIIYILYQSPCFIYLQIISDNFDVLILSTWFIKYEWVGRKHWVRVLALSENNYMMTLDKLLNILRLHCPFCKMSGRIHWMTSKGPVVWVWNFASLESTHHLQHHGRKLLSGSLPRFANQTVLSITIPLPALWILKTVWETDSSYEFGDLCFCPTLAVPLFWEFQPGLHSTGMLSQ